MAWQMTMPWKWLLAAMVLVWSCGQMHAQTADTPQSGWQMRTLGNGITTRYFQDSTRQLLHIGLTLRGGHSLDPADAEGLAKVYEQLFFQYLPNGRPAQQAEQSGIYLTHKTLLETHFLGMSLPPQQLQTCMQMLLNGLSATEWSDSAMQAAREAIVPGLQALDDAPENQLAQELRLALWQTFASRKQGVGKYADILRLSSQRILAEIAPYRHPANCLLSGTGPGTAEAFFATAEATLGQWHPESAGALLPKVDLPKLSTSIYFKTVNEFASQPLIMMAWPVPNAPDALAQQQLIEQFCTLQQLKQGQMYIQLIDSGLAVDYHWSWEGGTNPGQLLLSVIPRKERFAACLASLQTLIAHFGESNRYTAEEVATAHRLWQLQAAITHDQSIPRLVEAGQLWLLATDSLDASGEISAAKMTAFAAQNIQSRPHVAGLLLNSEAIATLGPDTVFQASVPAIAVADVGDTATSPPRFWIPPAKLRSLRLSFAANPLVADSSTLPLLREIASMLHDHPDKRIFLNSFSEGLGDGVKNYQASVTRAKAIRELLVDRFAIAPKQLVIRAYGEAFPEFPNEDDLRNRRLSFEYAPADAQDNVF